MLRSESQGWYGSGSAGLRLWCGRRQTIMVKILSGGELGILLGGSSAGLIFWFKVNGSEGSAVQVY